MLSQTEHQGISLFARTSPRARKDANSNNFMESRSLLRRENKWSAVTPDGVPLLRGMTSANSEGRVHSKVQMPGLAVLSALRETEAHVALLAVGQGPSTDPTCAWSHVPLPNLQGLVGLQTTSPCEPMSKLSLHVGPPLLSAPDVSSWHSNSRPVRRLILEHQLGSFRKRTSNRFLGTRPSRGGWWSNMCVNTLLECHPQRCPECSLQKNSGSVRVTMALRWKMACMLRSSKLAMPTTTARARMSSTSKSATAAVGQTLSAGIVGLWRCKTRIAGSPTEKMRCPPTSSPSPMLKSYWRSSIKLGRGELVQSTAVSCKVARPSEVALAPTHGSNCGMSLGRQR